MLKRQRATTTRLRNAKTDNTRVQPGLYTCPQDVTFKLLCEFETQCRMFCIALNNSLGGCSDNDGH
eukprot:370633-Amphidinium_carterae.1